MDVPAWTTIESDPGVFTELMQRMGVSGVQVRRGEEREKTQPAPFISFFFLASTFLIFSCLVCSQMEELYSVDPDTLRSLGAHVHGLVFLFKWGKEAAAVHKAQREKEEKEKEKGGVDTEMGDASSIFFAAQVVPNACATQAILSILLNRPEGVAGLSLGPELTELKAFAGALDPESRGLVVGGCERVRAAHASFTPPVPILSSADDKKDDDKEEAYHFISYVRCGDGGLYELDGLAPGPRRLGGAGAAWPDEASDGWLEAAAEAITARIAAYSGAEIRFNLMAVVQDRGAVARAAEAAALAAGDAAGAAAACEAGAAAAGVAAAWAAENERRRTNFVPFTLALMRHLAVRGELEPLIKRAREEVVHARAQHEGRVEGEEE